MARDELTWKRDQGLALIMSHSLSAVRRHAARDYSINARGDEAEAWFTLMIIALKDALQTLRTMDPERAVLFEDDLPQGVNVTKAVTDMRNAACHSGTPLELAADTLRFRFARVTAKGVAIVGPAHLENPYDGEIAFFYGLNRLLLQRHIVRAADECEIAGRAIAEERGLIWQAV